MAEEIVLTDVRETQWDEEAVLDSPYEARSFIRALPWKSYAEEIDEHGSLRAKAESRDADLHEAAFEAVEAYEESEGFSDDFATHASWDNEANAWTIDADAFTEAREFWEFAGFQVSVSPDVDTSML